MIYIDANLDGANDLETLASVANFSAFHSHRIFAAWMQETIGDYLPRRRLEAAAMELLVAPQELVTNIALAVGFGSVEAFSRAFRQRFGETPSD
jgi:AraC family transcriptional regulator